MGDVWLLNETEVQVSSNYINVANFLIFDVLLISLVFSLTADISGRMNHVALKGGEPRKLFILCPPLLGGGLCTTNSKRMVVMLCLRFLALVFILVTNLAIKGLDIQKERTVIASVLGPGSLKGFNETSFTAALTKRRQCTGTYNDKVYYGEIRNETYGERNRTLLNKPVTIESFRREIEQSADGCDRHIQDFGTFGNKKSLFFCRNGVIECMHNFLPANASTIRNSSCRGVIQRKKYTYVLDEGQAVPEMKKRDGYLIENFDWRHSSWTNASNIVDNKIFDAIAVSLTAAPSVREVRENVTKPTSFVHNAWFVILGVKCALIAVLVAVAGGLRRAGFVCKANDEYRLTKLLSTSVAQAEGCPPGEAAPIFLNAQEDNDQLVVWASERPQTRQRNSAQRRREELSH